MNERQKFIEDWMKEDWDFATLCSLYGISRKTGYKWVNRFEAGGLPALLDASRAPRSHPNATPSSVEAAIIELREARPHWGPKKILHRLRRIHPDNSWPSPSTIGTILSRRGLVAQRPKRRRVPLFKGILCEGMKPNDVWTADFKGWFVTTDGTRIDPLTISDAASRYLIRCRAVSKTNGETVQAHFTSAFQEYGMPRAVRTDNGTPFASRAMGGLSRLAIWLIKLGITPERIRPGHPQDNGAHERMHRTLKQETAKPPKANLNAQQAAFDRFRQEYNNERPHEALEMQTPEQIYTPSPRKLPARVPSIEYPSHMLVRKVTTNAHIGFRTVRIPIGPQMIGERVALFEVEDGRWAIQFGPLPIAHYDLRTNKIVRL
jgi:transposase InsO family protein